MAKKPAPAPAAPVADHLALAVAAASPGGQPYMATRADMASLSGNTPPLAEFNETIADGDKIAWRATAAGVEAFNARPAATPANPNPAPNTPATPARTYTFDDGITIPPGKRGGRGPNTYGFEHMAVGQSFFAAATDAKPNPAKSLASTVSSASKRHAPMKFEVRTVDETAQGRGKGARVWRTA